MGVAHFFFEKWNLTENQRKRPVCLTWFWFAVIETDVHCCRCTEFKPTTDRERRKKVIAVFGKRILELHGCCLFKFLGNEVVVFILQLLILPKVVILLFSESLFIVDILIILFLELPLPHATRWFSLTVMFVHNSAPYFKVFVSTYWW